MGDGGFFDDSDVPVQARPTQAATDAHAVAAMPAGARLLAHLRERTIDRALSPAASDAELRHLEGQRDLVRYVDRLIALAENGA